jgi:protein TonB
MKIDLLGKKWLDIVFEGRNKSYGAYDLRKNDGKTNLKAFGIGAVVFAFAVATPMIADFIGNASSSDDEALNQKITTVKLPPKEEKPKENLPPPPPPPPKVDQVKFVKPVVAKTNEVTEEPPKVEDIKDKKLGAENIKGNNEAPLTVEPVGNGPAKQEVVEEDNTIYNSAAVQVQASFQGGPDAWRKYLERSYQAPEEPGLNGKVLVSFVVEKDGSLTDIKVLKDIGFGTGAEAVRILKKGPKWTPAVQNGRNVRSTFTQSFSIVTAEE